MARRLSNPALSSAAYTLVDLSDLDDETRKDIIEDASAGGGNYGVRVVEEVVNGGASAPLYGYYKDGPDAERWAKAKKELGISATEVDDGEVSSGAGGPSTDPRREAALREAAAQRVEAEADRIRAGEDAEVAAITGEETSVRAGANSATDNHTTNIVDSTLDSDAENEVNDVASSSKAAKPKTKTPR